MVEFKVGEVVCIYGALYKIITELKAPHVGWFRLIGITNDDGKIFQDQTKYFKKDRLGTLLYG